MKIKSLCVFCGSSFGNSDIYKKEAAVFAEELCERGISLVYGGGSAGLMGVLASTIFQLRKMVF
jgi:predicted Rossmann-fold nucleotide-binding protein